MSRKKIVDAELPGLPVSINEIAKGVGSSRAGDVVTALIPFEGYEVLVENRLASDYPYSRFEISIKEKERKLWIEILVCKPEQIAVTKK